nr:unnamed protein product [Digitaria exilis]
MPLTNHVYLSKPNLAFDGHSKAAAANRRTSLAAAAAAAQLALPNAKPELTRAAIADDDELKAGRLPFQSQARNRTRCGDADFRAREKGKTLEFEMELGEPPVEAEGFIAALWMNAGIVAAGSWTAGGDRIRLAFVPREIPGHHAKSSTSSPNPNPIHTKSRKTAMAGGEGSSRSKGAKRKAEAMKEVMTTEKAAPTGDMPSIEDPISDWPTSNLKEKYIKILESDGFLGAQGISQWSLPPLDPTNTEEASLLARCVDPGVRDQVRQRKQPATEECDEPHAHVEQQVLEEPQGKTGATSKRGEEAKRPATTELQAPVPKRARTLTKPRARVIPEERAKVSPQFKTPSSVGIAIGEIGTSTPQPSPTAQQPLSEAEILHNIFNPETEEEFTLGEPEIPMRPSTM